MVVKKDGRREKFDRQKVLSGLLHACEKRPVPAIKLEEIHQPGLIDLYTNQFSVSGTVFSVSGSPWSVRFAT